MTTTTHDIRQILLNLLEEYRELETPANPELLKLYIDNAVERIRKVLG